MPISKRLTVTEGVEMITSSKIDHINMRKLITFCSITCIYLSGLFGAEELRANSCVSAHFSSQAQVDSIETDYPGCTTFLGVTISGPDIVDLSPLSIIESFGHGLQISDNAMLESLKGLPNMTSMSHLAIERNARLPDLKGLEIVSTGTITVSDNPGLKSLEGLEKLETISVESEIRNNSSLESLAGLDGLLHARSLHIIDNPALISLTGLSSLARVEVDLVVQGSPLLKSLHGLYSLAHVQTLKIKNNDGLTNFSGLETLKTISIGLVIDDNDSLVELEGLSLLNHLGYLSIYGNAKLSSISVLKNVDTFKWWVSIRYNPSLSSLIGLDRVSTSISRLQIMGNDSLTTLTGLANLSSVTGRVDISSNKNLTNLEGLDNLTSVENSLYLIDNRQLDDCSALISLLDEVDDDEPGPGPGVARVPDVRDDVVLIDNPIHCNTVERIRHSLDYDEDGIANSIDNCPEVENPDQEDSNDDGKGDACPDQIVQPQRSHNVLNFSGNFLDSPHCYGMIEINGQTLANVYLEKFGCELWRLGPVGEHQLLVDINNGPVGAATDIDPGFGLHPPMSGWYYFEANDGINGNQLWRTDSFTVGTVGDDDLFTNGGRLVNRGILNGRLYYSVLSQTNEYVIYSTDGLTVQLEPDLDVDATSFAELLGTFYDNLFYLGSDSQHGSEPWIYNGSNYQILEDIAAGSVGSMNSVQNNQRFNDFWLLSVRESDAGGEINSSFYKTDGVILKELPHSGKWIDFEVKDATVRTMNAVYMVMQFEPVHISPPIVIGPPPPPPPSATHVLRLNDSSTSGYTLGNHILSDTISSAAVLGDDALVLNDNRLYKLRETSAKEIALPLPSNWENSTLEFVGSGRYFEHAYIKETDDDGESRMWAWSFKKAGLLMTDDGHSLLSADHFRHIGNNIYFYGEDEISGRALRKISDNVIKPVPLMGAVTGSWYDPSTSGQGFVLYPVDDNRTVISFFGFEDDGTPMWLTGVGEDILEPGQPIDITLYLTSGGNFGEFNPDQISDEPWGNLNIVFNTCKKAIAVLDGLSGKQTMVMVRLAGVDGLECYANTPPKPNVSGITGSWYDPATSGQGFNLYPVSDERMVITFYGFKNNSKRLWLLGVYDAQITIGETLTLEMMYASGGQFGGFTPDDITEHPWGTMTINYTDCRNATATLDGVDGKQTMAMVRLAGLQGADLDCQ